MSAKKPVGNGEKNSRSSKTFFKRAIGRPTPELERMLKDVFAYWQTIDDPAKRREYRQDFVFHMSDWLTDLAKLFDLYGHPERYTKGEAGERVFGFFIHALHHLNAARRILFHVEDYEDPFSKLYPARKAADESPKAR